MSDENMEMENSSESSTEETSSESVTEDVNKSEQMIPKSRFDEVNAKYKELKGKIETAPRETPVQSNKAPVEDSWKRWMEFVVENKDLDKEQLTTAKRLYEAGTPLGKVLEDPLYVAFTEKHLKEKAEKTSTVSSGRSPKVTPEKPITEMTREEHEAYFKKALGK